MALYLIMDDPDLDAFNAISRSEAMMKGHKLELFCLDLSFFGWYLLGIVTFGIAVLYAQPYHMAARAAFYENLKASQNQGAEDDLEKLYNQSAF